MVEGAMITGSTLASQSWDQAPSHGDSQLPPKSSLLLYSWPVFSSSQSPLDGLFSRARKTKLFLLFRPFLPSPDDHLVQVEFAEIKDTVNEMAGTRWRDLSLWALRGTSIVLSLAMSIRSSSKLVAS
jgi:hypothetical protein